MKLILGIGNPGKEYEGTRHNVGFMVLDCLADRHGARKKKRHFHAYSAETDLGGGQAALVKPTTFVNLAGQAAREMLDRYALAPCDMLELGRLRLRPGGSSGGHNGLKSIFDALGTTEVPRLRVGIGSPRPGEAVDHVLSRFGRAEKGRMTEAVGKAADAVEMWAAEGVEKAMNVFNKCVEEEK
jgi:PTH1 family peptidyl-tRNA hydrolase